MTSLQAGQRLVALGSRMSTLRRGARCLRSPSQRCFSQTTETTVPVETARADVSNATQSSTTEHNSGLLYDSHTPLNAWQRAAVAVGSALGALASPERADLVAALGETTGHVALARMRARMAADPTGAQLLAEKPRITDETLQACWELPEHTFGGAYARFMNTRQFLPHERPPVRFVDDPELAYVAARAREVHDLWHVLFGCSTSVSGELALKAVEAVQTGMPSAALAAVFGPVRLSAARRRQLLSVHMPWALRAGVACVDLMCIPYERHFPEPLDVVRARWRIVPAPPFAAAATKGGVTETQTNETPLQ